jgi:hypothetical protein
MRDEAKQTLSSGAPYKGTMNMTMYSHCTKLSKALLLSKGGLDDLENNNGVEEVTSAMELPLAVLLLHDPLSGEMARAFGETIIDAVLHNRELNATMEDEIRTLYEICKVWNWGHTYMEAGNSELPGWFFRHVELFIYHTLQEVVKRIGTLNHATMKKLNVTNGKLCNAIEVVCTMARGAAEALPAGSMIRKPVRSSGALLLLKACESVEYSILNACERTMTLGEVVFAMVVAKDAVSSPDRDALGSDNTFAHLFTSGTPLNFLRRAANFAKKWKDKTAHAVIASVEMEMRIEVFKLDEEAKHRRKNNKRELKNDATPQKSTRTRSPSASEQMTKRELFGDSTDDEDIDKNQWMTKYPGVTKISYWNEEKSNGAVLEKTLKTALRMSSDPSTSNDF